MGVYLSIKTKKINDKELKEKLSKFYLRSSAIPWELELSDFLQKSENDDYDQIIKTSDLSDMIDKVDKIYNSFEKKFKNLLKILSCIKVNGYINKKNIVGQENTLEYELNEIIKIYENFIEKNNEYLKNDKDIGDILEEYSEKILENAEYIDNVLERFKNSYKNDETIYSEIDYLFGEICEVLMLKNLLEIAKKYDLELVRG